MNVIKFKENAGAKIFLAKALQESSKHEFSQLDEGEALLAFSIRSGSLTEGFQNAYASQLYLYAYQAIELNTREEPKLKIASPVHTTQKDRPKLEIIKKKEASEFKPKPIKREESDMQNFKQIFIDPRQNVLSQIQ